MRFCGCKVGAGWAQNLLTSRWLAGPSSSVASPSFGRSRCSVGDPLTAEVAPDFDGWLKDEVRISLLEHQPTRSKALLKSDDVSCVITQDPFGIVGEVK